MLGVLILLARAGEFTPLLDARSSKSLAEYGACFSREAERANRAWSYMPSERGGTFTDSGSHEAPASYWLQLRSQGSKTHLRLIASGSAPAPEIVEPEIVEAVGKCR